MEINSDQLRWMILGLVREYGHVTFVDIHKRICSDHGSEAFVHPGFENLIIWDGLSTKVAKAIEALLSQRLIFIEEATERTYLLDGTVPNLPIAKKVKSYSKPHWLPVCFHHTESKG